MSAHSKRSPRLSEPHAGLLIIGIFKLLKCATLIAVGIGALTLLHRDAAEVVSRWLVAARIDLDSSLAQAVLSILAQLSPVRLGWISIATFAYALVFAVEGVGLIMRRRWAEYLTVIVTCSFIPFEAYELINRPNAPKAVTVAINVVVVIYLIVRLRSDKKEREAEPLRPLVTSH